MHARQENPTGRRRVRASDRGSSKPATNRPVWVDLGCGATKQSGFIGIDRFALPGVDIVCDLDRGIPLPSDSAEHVLASHSLEHLKDLPAAIAEIYRVCKDRAVVTVIAPYDSTRLNRANPYHVNVWNEHTPRFVTASDTPTIDPDEYRFPAIAFWGLQASDYTQSEVDLRCLRMEFSYFPPYRALDEPTKRTLRQSLSDVCDQMAVHLLVVKSPISHEELSTRAATLEFPVPPSFEARRREEADTGAQNLFSELAAAPAQITALSTEATRANQEIALLGEELRRFLQRVDHLDRALVAETQESQRLIQRADAFERALVAKTQEGQRSLQRVDALERALVEKTQEGQRSIQRVDDLERALVAATQEGQRSIQRVDDLERALVAATQEGERSIQRVDDLERALVAEIDTIRRDLAGLGSAGRTLSERMTAINSALTRRMQAAADDLRGMIDADLRSVSANLRSVSEQQLVQANFGEQILHHLVAERRARADRAFWPLRFLRRYRQRNVDLRNMVGGELARLREGPEAPKGRGFQLQLGTFLEVNRARTYAIKAAGSPLRGIDFGISAMFPPIAPVSVANYELLDVQNNQLRAGAVTADPSCNSAPFRIDFEPVSCAVDQPLVLRLIPQASVERLGMQLFEWHRITRFVRHVPELRLAYRGRY